MISQSVKQLVSLTHLLTQLSAAVRPCNYLRSDFTRVRSLHCIASIRTCTVTFVGVTAFSVSVLPVPFFLRHSHISPTSQRFLSRRFTIAASRNFGSPPRLGLRTDIFALSS